jgi:signal transduction histidine kinase
LREITLATTSTLELDTILNTLLETVQRLLPYDACTVRLLNEHGEFQPLACRNFPMAEWMAGFGMGFGKEILQRKRPVISMDLQADPRSRRGDFFKQYGFVSFIGIPLSVKDEIIGVLSLYKKTTHRFAREEINFLSTIAGQVAIAIHNSQLYEQTKKQETENAALLQAFEKQAKQAKSASQFLGALYSVSSIASRSLNINAVAKEVIKRMTEIFDFNCTRIFLLDPNSNELVLKASYETHPEYYNHNNVFPVGRGIIGKVAQTGQALIFEDISRSREYRKLSHSRTTNRAGLKFFAVFPIKKKSTTIGVINFSARKPRQLAKTEFGLIKSMISHIAIAVDHSSLFDASEQKIKELSALYSLARIINTSVNFESVLRRIKNEVLTMFRCDSARIYLYNEDDNSVSVLADRTFAPVSFPKPTGLFAKLIRDEQPLFFEDIPNDPNYRLWSGNQFALKQGFQSGFYLPIKAKGKIVGAISFFSKSKHQFLPAEKRIINCIVDHLGTAVENTQLYDAMERSRQQLQNLAERLQLAREEERARLARRLHDELGQALAALKMEIETLTADAPQDPGLMHKSKRQLFNLIDSMVNTVRRIANILRPPIFDEMDLTAAIEQTTREFEERTGISCKIRSNVRHHFLDKVQAVAVLRIFQETLSNIQRHSGANRVDIEWTKSRSGVSLKIQDNGKGIRQEALRRTQSLGIIGMRERAILCGGTLHISGRRNFGTTVSAYIPSRSHKREAHENPDRRRPPRGSRGDKPYSDARLQRR